MTAIHNHLIQKSTSSKMTYTAELVPETQAGGEMSVLFSFLATCIHFYLRRSWRLTPKQDHLVCFFGGSLMLGATFTGAIVHRASIPPQADELSEAGKRDWKTGAELVKTCMNTHDTATFVFLCDSRDCFLTSVWVEGCRQKLCILEFRVMGCRTLNLHL